MGKYILFGVIAFLVLILGMLFFPTVNTNVSGIDVTGFTALEKAGMALLPYIFLGLMVYIIFAHVKKDT